MLSKLHIPFEPQLFGWPVNVHLILEYVAFFAAYRYYVHLRKNRTDQISLTNRYSIILGAALGALIGSRVMAFLENPVWDISAIDFIYLYNLKTIMGGLFGGLLGVEIAKIIIREKNSSGDLFTLPIIVGLLVGRLGCFLAGTREFTYGKPTSFVTGMNLGDGIMRHPLALYEIVFLIILYFVFRRLYYRQKLSDGLLFKFFMLSYFGFRFLLEFLKPNVFFLFGLSSIQWLCIACFVYYRRTLINLTRANQELHLL